MVHWFCLFCMRILFLHLLREQWNITTLLGKLTQTAVMYPLGLWMMPYRRSIPISMAAAVYHKMINSYIARTGKPASILDFNKCEVVWNLDIYMLVSSVADILQWLTALKVSLTLQENLINESLSTLFLSGTCFLQLMSAATTGKFLFHSFIFFGNCHYQEKSILRPV